MGSWRKMVEAGVTAAKLGNHKGMLAKMFAEKDGFKLCMAHVSDRPVSWRPRSASHATSQAPHAFCAYRTEAGSETPGQPEDEGGPERGLAHSRATRWLLRARANAYYGFRARVVGSARDSAGEGGRAEVEVMPLGVKFSIQDGALHRQLDELLWPSAGGQVLPRAFRSPGTARTPGGAPRAR